MNIRSLLHICVLGPLTCAWTVLALADDATTTLNGSNVKLALERLQEDDTTTALDSDGLSHYFSKGRCLCPTNVAATVTLDTTGASALGSNQADVSLVLGNDCSSVNATDCTTLGQNLTLSGSKTTTSNTLTTSSIFQAALGSNACSSLSATSNRLWAIVRVAGARVSNPPSLAIGLGAAAAAAPTGVSAETADKGLLVKWTAASNATAIFGYQVLCSPVVAKPLDQAYEICTEAMPTISGTFATLDPTLVCSDLVSVGQNSVRVSGLENGTSYEVAVVAVGRDGLPSAPSKAATGTPGPTMGFEDIYRADGGTATPGCSVGGGTLRKGQSGAPLLVGLLLAWRRRRPRGTRKRSMHILVLVTLALATARSARADLYDEFPTTSSELGSTARSSRTWNLELRFGPYRPEVDTELADRGQSARPYAEVFGSSHHLMTQLEIDRQLMHQSGTLAVGLGAGYFKVSAAALGSDHVTRTGDSTSLRLIPLSVSLIYRADFIPEHTPIPFAPFVKAGLDCGLWSLSDSSDTGSSNGVTLGWHAAAGAAMYLDFLDPDAARTLDQDAGVNHAAIFFEWGRYALDGLGEKGKLRVGDTAWLAGVMLEL